MKIKKKSQSQKQKIKLIKRVLKSITSERKKHKKKNTISGPVPNKKYTIASTIIKNQKKNYCNSKIIEENEFKHHDFLLDVFLNQLDKNFQLTLPNNIKIGYNFVCGIKTKRILNISDFQISIYASYYDFEDDFNLYLKIENKLSSFEESLKKFDKKNFNLIFKIKNEYSLL